MRLFSGIFLLSFLMLGYIGVDSSMRAGHHNALEKHLSVQKIVLQEDRLNIIATNSFDDGFTSFVYKDMNE